MMKIIRIIALELSRTLLRLAMDPALRRELPEIFKHIDIQMPRLIGDGPDAVRTAIGEAITSATKHHVTAEQISGVIALYDPTAAAKRTSALADAVGTAVHDAIRKQQRPGGLLGK